MTFKVDNDALKAAMMRHYEEKLAKELREIFVYSTDPEMAKIWQYYMEELDRQEQRQAQHTDVAQMLFIFFCLGMMGYGLYRLIAFTPT